MRTRLYSPAVILFVLTLSFPAILIAQQSGTARRQPNETPSSLAAKAGANSRVTSAVVKSDLSEALSVIQDNYIDGKKLDYNSIFKSSISGMLNVLDPHSTYFDAV